MLIVGKMAMRVPAKLFLKPKSEGVGLAGSWKPFDYFDRPTSAFFRCIPLSSTSRSV